MVCTAAVTARAPAHTARPCRAQTTVCSALPPNLAAAAKRTGAAVAGGLLATSLLLMPGSAMAASIAPPSSITLERQGVPDARERLQDQDVKDVREAVEQQGGKLKENVKSSSNRLNDVVTAVKKTAEEAADSASNAVEDNTKPLRDSLRPPKSAQQPFRNVKQNVKDSGPALKENARESRKPFKTDASAPIRRWKIGATVKDEFSPKSRKASPGSPNLQQPSPPARDLPGPVPYPPSN